MSKIIDLSNEEPSPFAMRYGPAQVCNPLYYSLLIFVAVIGGASLFARWSTDTALASRARRGDAEAQYLLGKHYFDEALSPRDYTRAAGLIRKSAGQGYARAQAALGLLYENGRGVPQDYTQAGKWLRRAADQRCAVAQNELGVMYAKGRGFSQNLKQAAYWCRLAAAQGSEVARRNLQLTEVLQTGTIPQITTTTQKTYRFVRLQKLDSEGVTFSFRPASGGFGLAKLKLDKLPQELQQLCKCSDEKGTTSNSAYSQLGCVAGTL